MKHFSRDRRHGALTAFAALFHDGVEHNRNLRRLTLTQVDYLISTAIRSAGRAESFDSACFAAPDTRTSSAFAFGWSLT